MVEKMSFLTIPPRKGLFTTVKNEGSKGRAECYDEGQCNSDEEFEESEETNVRLIPRSSPIPRKRGQSIYDETAEYMKIKDAITSRRVSFADTIGADLAQVKEFIQFNSDDENDSRWEEEEAKYRPKISEPTFRVSPEWTTPTATALMKAVHINKVEVESLSLIEDEPLAFIVFIRVLNISFKKTVCVRSTMDNWNNYFDCPAEYVQGDGETDKFSFKLSFCPPYLHHGSRIEFVVRYETPDGDYWANNLQMNYAVTLLVSYEENVIQDSPVEMQCRRSILKTESSYRMEDSDYFELFTEKDEDEPVTEKVPEMAKPTLVSPDVLQEELDLETADDIPSSSLPANLDLPSGDGSLFCAPVSLGKQSPTVSSTSTTDEVMSTPVTTQANIAKTKPELSVVLVSEMPIHDCKLPKSNCEILKLDGKSDSLPKEEPEDQCLPALNMCSTPVHSGTDEASEPTPWLITITEVSEEKVGGPFQEKHKDGSPPTLLSVSTNSHMNLTEPDPPHMDIRAKQASLGDVTDQNVLPAVAMKEVGEEKNLPNQESELEEEVPRQKEEKATEEENEKSIKIQEPDIRSSGLLIPLSNPTHCKLYRVKEVSSVCSSPSLHEVSKCEQLSSTENAVTREDGVSMTEAVGPRLEGSQAGGEKFAGAAACCPSSMMALTHFGPIGENRATPSLASQSAELIDDSPTPPPAFHQLFKRGEVDELAPVLFEDSGSSEEQDSFAASAKIFPVLESQAPMGVQCKAASSVITTQEGIGSSNEKGRSSADESEEFIQLSSETHEGVPSRSSEGQIPRLLAAQTEPSLGRTLIPSMVGLSVVIGLVMGIYEPGTIGLMGLFFVSLYF